MLAIFASIFEKQPKRTIMNKELFSSRHIGPREEDQQKMLETIGVKSITELIDLTIPASIRSTRPLQIPKALTEYEYLNHLRKIGRKNKNFKSYIGLGYYNTITPSVIKRNILENPGWYTAYTPYQAEIAQGRLEALLNFQTMVSDLTAMEITNSSLLDEGTAAAEAMIMFYNSRSATSKKAEATTFFVSEKCFPQTIDILKTRATPLGINLVIGDHNTFEFDASTFGVLLQYPNVDGKVEQYADFVQRAKNNDCQVAAAADLLSLTLLTPPGEWGADAVVGSTQRFGIPMGYGGPHAAYFSTKETYKRHIPGRIIGVSQDRAGNKALRMALQTREQHIKRDRATSNICTAQVLLAVMAGMYAAYHGPKGLKRIAQDINANTASLIANLKALGITVSYTEVFDTLHLPDLDAAAVRKTAEENELNFRYNENGSVCITLDETTTEEDVEFIANVIAKSQNKEHIELKTLTGCLPEELCRTSAFMEHPVFHLYHSETEMMRYMKRLENKDLSLTHSMIPLGSCTMKLNAATQLMPLGWTEFAEIHPFVPENQALGYRQMISELESYLSEITGFHSTSLQPNSGAQGEYAGLMVIRAYHQKMGQHHRDIALIPSSAHGTNPASAVMAGMKVIVVKCDDNGNIDVEDLRIKAVQYKTQLAALMITYPSTHGVFEEGVREITQIIHDNGGQVYMDGANMNAQVGLTSPGLIGADVCHLNLHKTFAIPHGGGGPGMGPIGVAEHLAPFLPSNPITPTGGNEAITAISAAPFGSALILLISYGYIRMLGTKGVTNATEMAILNANYLKAKLKDHFGILYQNKNKMVAHEMILECRNFKTIAGIEVVDIAKRLMDYGFHAPTVSFPVAGTIMVEPTESESLHELDRFAEALISIRNEIAEVIDGIADPEDNVIKNAPHTVTAVCTEWTHQYSREKAVFPLEWVKNNKFWPSVERVNDAFGDRNLICACPPMEEYEMIN
jgi:glycine dehydrogenase